MEDNSFTGLDFDFLRYIGVKSETQKRIQSFYLPYFAGRQKIVDLGCGDADFVELLRERGFEALGVDSDDKAYAAACARGLPILKRDVFEYLKETAAGSVDGIFSAHLVEHLTHQQVIQLVHESFRILRPGGIIILATPNVRSLYSHLEMFYLHFGHISFYHPRLLCFFLEREGFVDSLRGENPETASPLLADLRGSRYQRSELVIAPEAETPGSLSQAPRLASGLDGSPSIERTSIDVRRGIPLQNRALFHRIGNRLRQSLAQWLVLPFVDYLAQDVEHTFDKLGERSQSPRELIDSAIMLHDALRNESTLRREQVSTLQQEVRELRGDIGVMRDTLLSLDGAFECFALAYKR